MIERLFAIPVVRWLAGLAFLCRSAIWRLLGREYRRMEDVCWVARVAATGYPAAVARRAVSRTVESIHRGGQNTLTESFLADAASKKLVATYALAGEGGTRDLWRDLIVLKQAGTGEKGVILLKYAHTFSAVAALFDLPRLMESYTFVLEPCWAGFCNTNILEYFMPGQPVVIQCFTDEDSEFIERIGDPFVPVRLGPADWVDAGVFSEQPATVKDYDLVMVANWGAHKRHEQLFRALHEIRDREIRVLLVGFPWAGRSADDICREAARHLHDGVTLEIVENVPQRQLAGYVGRCKAFVFLSRKEGDNKALVEAMFANVPAIVFAESVGGARSRINPSTGVLAADDELAGRIRFMLDHYREFRPREWALAHTGSKVATRILNDALGRATLAAGGSYSTAIVEKTNAPNLAYKDEMQREQFADDYALIAELSRYPAARSDGPSSSA